MRKIFCFGDSNIYGFNPKNGSRFDKNSRWSGILQTILGADYEVIEAGCNNRTAFSINPAGKMMTGIQILPELLKSDFDIVVLAIGINDLQVAYNVDISTFDVGLQELINIVKKQSPNAEILLIAPSVINKNILNSYFATLFDEKSIEKSYCLGEIYKKIAQKNSCEFLNFEDIAKVSKIDGLHYEKDEHEKIARVIANLLSSKKDF